MTELGLEGCKQSSVKPSDSLITVDVTKTDYPKKDLALQDFMDVEYVALETNDEFLNQGIILDIGKKFILVRNWVRDGNIFIYDRNGKAIRKINRRGQGGEEYTDVYRATLDESNDEIFVSDFGGSKILVYDLNGNYKRSLKHKGGNRIGTNWYSEVFNYDKDNLICYDEFNKDIAFVLISKQDGSITKEIKIPFQKKIEVSSTKSGSETMVFKTGPGEFRHIIPYKGNWILLEVSSDTVYSLLPDYSLRPLIVRTPPVQSMNPEVVLIFGVMSDRYYFMETIKNEYNWDKNVGFPKTRMVYDKQGNSIFNYYVYNKGDYTDKVTVIEDMSVSKSGNNEIDSWQTLKTSQLVEEYKNGQLQGQLKEVAAGLKEDDNPVIMLFKYKK